MAPRLTLATLFFNIATTEAATSAFWTYTSRIADFVSPSPYTRYNGEVTTYFDTTYRTVKSTVTPTATPTSTSTYLQTYYDLQVVYAYYPTGVVAESDLEPERTYDYSATTTSTTTDTYLYFSMPVTMTAPASCPTAFTVTTTASVSVPSEVTGQVTPTSTEDGTTSTGLYGNVYHYQTWYLSESAAPFTTSSDYYYEYYIASCSTPPVAYTGSPRSGGSDDDDDDSNTSSSRYCYYSSYYCGTPLRTWIIVIASVIPGLFLLGFLESWFWFRRLMLGKSAMRFGTVCWVLISLWVLCFTRMQDRRSIEDQKILAEKWKNFGSGAAFKAWWKWGFRHAYPVELLGQFSPQTVGIVPAGQPLHPAMAQAPYSTPGGPGAPPPSALQPVPGQPGQVFYYGPPPPGWVQAPNGGFIPPQGYAYPPPQQAGYYGDMAKDGSVVSSSPVSALGQQHPSYPMPPQAPQPVYTQPNVQQMPTPSPPPQASLPTPPQQSQAPVSPVSEVPDTQTPRPANHLPNPPPPRNDPNDRSLYE
ncbi:Nn.00g015020.m01.CDS01 [Neocucurbitaria sp. VM-36]